MNEKKKIFLNDSWALYFHNPYDIEWDTKSYKLIGQISTLEDYICYFQAFKDLFKKGMFFLMRLDIMPQYEDEYNKNGGCFSFKIYPEDLESRLFKLFANVIGENIGKDEEHTNNINGISISPKKFYYIARIWIKDNKYAKKDMYSLDIPKHSLLMYKNHI